MFNALPTHHTEFLNWRWEQFAPYLDELQSREITRDNVVEWLNDWARLTQMVIEIKGRLDVATTLNTEDDEATHTLNDFLANTFESVTTAEQQLKQKLLATRIEPPGFAIPLRDMRTEAALFREANVPLLTEEDKLRQEYNRINGAQTVVWEGEERPFQQMYLVLEDDNRAVRERAWHAMMDRKLQDRAALNDLWVQLLTLRLQIAKNADEPTYRDYIWKQRLRFDYTPEDCLRFSESIAETVIPAVERLYERKRKQLGVESIRPWDTLVDPLHRPPLRPYQDSETLTSTTHRMLSAVDPALGDYFKTMMDEHLLDLDNRRGKAPGAYAQAYPVSKRPFIFLNGIGHHFDVQTLLHESGHAFHAFEVFKLPAYQVWQSNVPLEFAEVASMSMELLAAPYLAKSAGGFYHDNESTHARTELLERTIRPWLSGAVIETFQHWVYTNPDAALNPDNCDAEWSRQWDRYMTYVDYSDLQAEKETGWHRILHIFLYPFYNVEYDLAQLGAIQVWGNALNDQAGAVRAYRHALSLGNTVGLPQLFEAAGATFAMDMETLQQAVDLIEGEINRLLEAESLPS